jgi:hypothetical protein
MKTDEEKNMAKQIVAFCNFLKAPKKNGLLEMNTSHTVLQHFA